ATADACLRRGGRRGSGGGSRLRVGGGFRRRLFPPPRFLAFFLFFFLLFLLRLCAAFFGFAGPRRRFGRGAGVFAGEAGELGQVFRNLEFGAVAADRGFHVG